MVGSHGQRILRMVTNDVQVPHKWFIKIFWDAFFPITLLEDKNKAYYKLYLCLKPKQTTYVQIGKFKEFSVVYSTLF